MIDLGAWASEAYRVPVAEAPEPDAPEAGRAGRGIRAIAEMPS